MKPALLLTLAAALVLPACSSVDESAPSHPRTAEILSPNQNEKDNADKRVLESPKHEVPTGSGSEYPGQSQAPALHPTILASSQTSPQVLTLANYSVPTDVYSNDTYEGNVPHLAEKPGTTYTTGTTPVPDTPWLIDDSWGQVLPLQNAQHRAWPETQTHYYTANVKNNPVYYFTLQEHLPVQQNDGSFGGNLISTAYEVPWFLATTAALPVLVVLDPPLSQHTTGAPSYDPNYNGFLSAQGVIVPSPQPGFIGWDYSFLKKADAPPDSQPAGYPIRGLDVPDTTSTTLPAIIPVPTTPTATTDAAPPATPAAPETQP